MSNPLRLLARPFAGALLLLAALPSAAHAGLFNPQTASLANGMEVVVIPDHRAPIVIHMVWYRVGAADEPPGNSGIAHFLEHLMFKGTESVPAGEFSRIVARNGGRDNAFTSHDFTGYFQSVAADKLELVMRMEADRMVNLTLDEGDVATERDVVLEERRARTDNDPSAILSEQASATQFLAHPYGIPVIGWEHEVRRLTLEDALAFYRTYYVPANAILVVAGDVTLATVLPLAEKYYGAIPARPAPQRLRPQEPPQRAARRIILEDERVSQPSWRRSYLAPSRVAGAREHALPLRVVAEILGGGATSRLYRRLVVEQKLAAGASAHYTGLSVDLDRFWISASPVPGGDVDALEAGIDAVIAELLAGGVSDEELARAKAGLAAAAVYARDSLNSAARIFGTALTVGLGVDDVESWPEQIEAITAEEVKAAAAAVFDRNRSVTSVLLSKPAS